MKLLCSGQREGALSDQMLSQGAVLDMASLFWGRGHQKRGSQGSSPAHPPQLWSFPYSGLLSLPVGEGADIMHIIALSAWLGGLDEICSMRIMTS